MILAPNHNNHVCTICSVGFTSLQLSIDHNHVQFCMSYHFWGHYNDTCTRPGTGHSCLPKLCSATLFYFLAVAHWKAHLKSNKAMSLQPLSFYYHTASKSYHYLASQDITQILCTSALNHPHFCDNPASMECCSLQTNGATTLFSCRIDALLIKLVGHWHSETMLHYLHVQSHPIMLRLSKLMLAGGNPQLLAETAIMPLPKPFIFVG
jgi:hypothetical protein